MAGGKKESPRKKGLKQGLFILLLTFLVVPLLAILSEVFVMEEAIIAVSAVLFFMGGILRMAYALLFESSDYPDFQEGNALATPNVIEFSSEKSKLTEGFRDNLVQAQTQEELFQVELSEKLDIPVSVTEQTTMLFEVKPSIKEESTQSEETLPPLGDAK